MFLIEWNLWCAILCERRHLFRVTSSLTSYPVPTGVHQRTPWSLSSVFNITLAQATLTMMVPPWYQQSPNGRVLRTMQCARATLTPTRRRLRQRNPNGRVPLSMQWWSEAIAWRPTSCNPHASVRSRWYWRSLGCRQAHRENSGEAPRSTCSQKDAQGRTSRSRHATWTWPCRGSAFRQRRFLVVLTSTIALFSFLISGARASIKVTCILCFLWLVQRH